MLFFSKQRFLLTLMIFLNATHLIKAQIECDGYAPKVYLLLGSGVSFSNKAHICVDQRVFDPAPQGYNNNLGSSEIYTAELGCKIFSFMSAGIEVGIRPLFKYAKFQSSSSSTAINATGTKVRNFRLSNSSVLANVCFYGSGIWDMLSYEFGCQNEFLVQPLLGAGIGISYNNLSDFHSVLCANTITSNGLVLNQVSNYLPPYTKRSLAGQVYTGLELLYKDMFSIKMGYRYFNGGSIRTNNYIISAGPLTAPTPTIAYQVPQWTGKLRCNEFFASIQYLIKF